VVVQPVRNLAEQWRGELAVARGHEKLKTPLPAARTPGISYSSHDHISNLLSQWNETVRAVLRVAMVLLAGRFGIYTYTRTISVTCTSADAACITQAGKISPHHAVFYTFTDL
jgi:hypothetical protein